MLRLKDWAVLIKKLKPSAGSKAPHGVHVDTGPVSLRKCDRDGARTARKSDREQDRGGAFKRVDLKMVQIEQRGMKRAEPPSPVRSNGQLSPCSSKLPASPTRSAASVAPRPHSAVPCIPWDRRSRQRAPSTMLDREPNEARLPGYTGHRPGLKCEGLCGRSFAYLTGYRPAMLMKDTVLSSSYNLASREALRFEPSRVLRCSGADEPRHISLGLDATKVSRPTSAAPATRKVFRHFFGVPIRCWLCRLASLLLTACNRKMFSTPVHALVFHISIRLWTRLLSYGLMHARNHGDLHASCKFSRIAFGFLQALWKSKEQFHNILNVSRTGHIPGYKGKWIAKPSLVCYLLEALNL
jgi:hypothetical protein